MKFPPLLFCFFLFNTASFSQIDKPVDVQAVLLAISSNQNNEAPEFEKLRIKDSLLEVLSIHYDYLSYNSKFELASKTQNKEDRILLYKIIRNYPWYLLRSPFYGSSAFNLYVRATNRLISEYRGNLDELNRITVVPGAADLIYGNLKIAIEFAGGVWTKGEILVDPEAIRRGNRYKKN